MSVKVSPGGLSGLIMQISEELKQGKSQDEILSKYPVSKTALPYLLTLQEEYSKMFLDFVREEFSPLEKENIALKEQIKRLESKKGNLKCVDTQNLKNELERLKNENLSLKSELESLREQINKLQLDNDELEELLQAYERDLHNYRFFFEKSVLCSLLFNSFLKKVAK